MDKLVDETIKQLLGEDPEELFEMANLQPRRTGIRPELYATFNGEKEGYKHGPRVKVKTSVGGVPIQLKPEVKLPDKININKFNKSDKDLIKEAIEYIEKNYDIFIQHWEGKIDDKDLIDELESRK